MVEVHGAADAGPRDPLHRIVWKERCLWTTGLAGGLAAVVCRWGVVVGTAFAVIGGMMSRQAESLEIACTDAGFGSALLAHRRDYARRRTSPSDPVLSARVRSESCLSLIHI